MSGPFIADSSDFEIVRARAAEVFHIDRRLPKQVFGTGFNKFAFLEFDVLLFTEFWHVLAACAEACHDEDISVVTHDPSADEYYFANFQRYGALRFQPTATAAEYKQAFLEEPPDSPADALQYVASVMSWCGSSREWGFWGERDLGVAVAGTRKPNMSWPQIEGITWFDLDGAAAGLIAPNFDDEQIPQEFVAALNRNFR